MSRKLTIAPVPHKIMVKAIHQYGAKVYDENGEVLIEGTMPKLNGTAMSIDEEHNPEGYKVFSILSGLTPVKAPKKPLPQEWSLISINNPNRIYDVYDPEAELKAKSDKKIEMANLTAKIYSMSYQGVKRLASVLLLPERTCDESQVSTIKLALSGLLELEDKKRELLGFMEMNEETVALIELMQNLLDAKSGTPNSGMYQTELGFKYNGNFLGLTLYEAAEKILSMKDQTAETILSMKMALGVLTEDTNEKKGKKRSAATE